MNRMHSAPRSVASNRTRRTTRRRSGAAALALFGFALGACDSDALTGPTGGEATLPHTPRPVDCRDVHCSEHLL